MKKISHVVNVADFPGSSDLHAAQPITLETMRIARDFAAGHVDVTLLSAQYQEDRKAVPDFFNCTRDLDRSVLDLGDFRLKRKLPLLQDILDRAYEVAESDYIIFTNVDISLLPNFYTSVDRLIDSGFDSFVINRRTITQTHVRVEDIPLMWAEAGSSHPGYDCFVFRRAAYKKFVLGQTCVGAPHIGKVLLANQMLNSVKFKVFDDQHLTFHLGDDRTWRSRTQRDYRLHNQREFEKIIASFDAAQQTRVRRALPVHRMRNLRNRLRDLLEITGNFLGIK